MKARQRIEAALKKGPVRVKAGKALCLLEQIRGRYRITITLADGRSEVYIYRKEPVAMDRFEEQIARFRKERS